MFLYPHHLTLVRPPSPSPTRINVTDIKQVFLAATLFSKSLSRVPYYYFLKNKIMLVPYWKFPNGVFAFSIIQVPQYGTWKALHQPSPFHFYSPIWCYLYPPSLGPNWEELNSAPELTQLFLTSRSIPTLFNFLEHSFLLFTWLAPQLKNISSSDRSLLTILSSWITIFITLIFLLSSFIHSS